MIHKGFRRFIDDDDVSGLQPPVVTKKWLMMFRIYCEVIEIIDLDCEDYH